MDIIPSCLFAINQGESVHHILCVFARAMENGSLIWKEDRPQNGPFSSFTDKLLDLNSSCSQGELEVISVCFWAIWSDRNKIVYDSPVVNVISRSHWIQNYIGEVSRKMNKSNPLVSGLNGAVIFTWPNKKFSSRIFETEHMQPGVLLLLPWVGESF